MSCSRDVLDFNLISAPLTLWKAFDRLEIVIWQILLDGSLVYRPLSGVTGIAASGVERAHSLVHYTRRTNLKIQQLATTLLVDTVTYVVLDIHVMTTRKRDTQIAPQVVKRNAESMAVLVGDTGYDDQKLRRLARECDICPLIEPREGTSVHNAWTARVDSDLYSQRNMKETVNAGIKQEFGAFGWSRVW